MADEIVAVYRAEVEQYKKAVDDLTKKVTELDKAEKDVAKTGETAFAKGKQSVDGMGSAVTSLTTGMKSLAAAVGIAFTVDRVVAFARESVKLAASAEGVERAFKRIGSPQILDGLRKATRGTVSDLQLMTNAVKASNFQIPLEQLASLFQFAQARARETGESVDYLVDSIILGIGRKSPLILDNLGISAVALREKFNGLSAEAAGVGDVAKAVGEIAEEEMAKMGNQADTAADKMAQLTTATDNLKIALGKLIIEESAAVTTFFATLAENIATVLTEEDRLRTELSGMSGLKLLARLREEQAKLAVLEADATEKVGKVREAEASKILQHVDNQRAVVAIIQEAINAKRDEGIQYDVTTDTIDRAIDAYNKLQAAQTGPVRSISLLNEELKTLREQLEKAEIGSDGFWNVLFKIEKKIKELRDAEAMTKLIEDLNPDADDNAAQDERIFSQTQAEIDKYNKLKKEREDYLKFLSEQNSKEIQAELERINEIEAAEKAARERKKQDEDDARAREIKAFIDYATAVSQTFNTIAQAQAQANQYELDVLQRSLEQGAISREEYDQQRKQLMRKQAQDAKNLAILQAVIGTAVGIANALPNIPLSIIAGVLGAVQIGIIAAEPLPQFATGVIGLQGAGTETSDSIMARLSKGESVMTAAETKKYRPLLEGMRKGTLDEIIQKNYVRPAIDEALLSGFADMGKSAALHSAFNDMNLLRAIDRHRETEVNELRMMNALLSKYVRTPKRGYA